MSNSFGKFFKVTTFGESHGKKIGVVIDGCPSNLEINEEEINLELKKRRPNINSFVSKRDEIDNAKIISGVFDGKTTGAPICIIIENTDVISKNYDEIKDCLRPSHANYTYLKKYKIFDHRGASRASARETASRVAAGLIAKKLLKKENINIYSYLKTIGNITAKIDYNNFSYIDRSKVFCPDLSASKKMIRKLKEIKKQNDSIGSIVEFCIENVKPGIGQPIFDKLNAYLAYALMSIPAAKGFEIGDGFEAVNKKGSKRNDYFVFENNKIKTKTNNEGGILAGISNGEKIIGRVIFKPTSSINQKLETIDIKGNKKIINYQDSFRFDVCIGIRAVAVVGAMCAITLADLFLQNKIYE